jgi:cellulose synthase/poly-beta-1,6-N-acetylglucosamine synthase-like glycosyltransferase
MEPRMTKVSVVIPAYNCAKYLPTALESVLAQTYRDFEIVVVDDGSTDDTESVIRGYAPAVRYLKTANSGPASARNRGIRASVGEYVAFLDADDWWEPKKLEAQVHELKQDADAALAYSDMCVHCEDGSTNPSFLKSRPFARSGYVFDQLMESQFIFPSAALIRRRCLESVGLFDESLHSLEDCDLFLRLCYERKVVLVGEPLVHRRQRGGGLTSNQNLSTQYLIKFQEKALTLPHLSARRRRRLRWKLSMAYLSRARYCRERRLAEECRSNLVASLKSDWRNSAAFCDWMISFLPPSLLTQFKQWRQVAG